MTLENSWPRTSVDAPAPKVPGMSTELARNLANFDDLDFHVYPGSGRLLLSSNLVTSTGVVPFSGDKEIPRRWPQFRQAGLRTSRVTA